jgi:hypothetical protein
MRLQLVLCDDWHGNTGCLVAQDLALLTKVGTLIHEEISLLTVLYFPFRARTTKGLQKRPPFLNTIKYIISTPQADAGQRYPARLGRFVGG